jgi:hypothetical protein
MHERRFAALGATSIVLASLYIFWPQLGFYFTDVDTFTLISTSKFSSWDEFISMLGSPMMNGQLSNALFYRPVSSITWAFDYMNWGTDPRGYHLTDLLLHTTTSLVFFSVLANVARWQTTGASQTRGQAEALLAALLFAIHPIAMETVPAIARRPDLLFGLFAQLTLLSVYFYLRNPKLSSLGCAALCCVLGIASKDSAVAIPAVAVVFVFCFSTASSLRVRVMDCLRVGGPILIATALYIAVRIWVLGGIGGYAGDLVLPLASVFKTSVATLLCAVAAPGNLDVCTPDSHPLFGAMLVALVAALAVQMFPFRNDAATRRFAFGALSLLVFLALFVAVRTPALTRTIYALIPFICILVAWGVVDGAQLIPGLGHRLGADEPPGAVASASRFVSGALSIAVAASIVFGGLTRVYLDEWRALGDKMQATLTLVAPHMDALRRESVVYLLNFPHKISDPAPVLRDHPLFQDHSVQGWADLTLPEKKLDIVGLSYVHFVMRQPEEVRFEVSFDSVASRIDISLGEGGKVVPYPAAPPYGKRHPLRVISRERKGEANHLAIELTPDAMSSDNVAFLVYLGDRVELRGRESWTLSYNPAGQSERSER